MKLFGRLEEGDYVPKFGIFWQYLNTNNWFTIILNLRIRCLLLRWEFIYRKKEITLWQ
jgi:hypothetical protein